MGCVGWPTGEVAGPSGVGDIVHGGRTYTGLGHFASVQISSEGATTVPQEIVAGIAGTLEDLLQDVGPEAEGAAVEILIGAVTSPGGTTLVGDPIVISGRVASDVLEVGETPRLTIVANTGPAARAGARIRHSDDDQQRQFPGDQFFDRCANAKAWVRLQNWPE